MLLTIQDQPSEAAGWPQSMAKRVFDVCCALLLIIVTAPLIAILAVLVAVTSRGPVLFCQTRLGLHGRRFVLLKFRTMRHASSGLAVTQSGDPRVTSFGRVLRAFKLDELPQIVNVLRGDMTMVGPRPDLPQYWFQAQRQAHAVLALRPGITGAASLRFRNEEAILASVPADRITDYYVNVHLPHKAMIDLEYALRAGFWSDCAILVKTLLPFLCTDEERNSMRCASRPPHPGAD